MGRYPKLPEHLRELLQKIEPSSAWSMDYYPCIVTTRSGTTLDGVYIQDEVRIGDVVSLAESPCRLPARFASQLYR